MKYLLTVLLAIAITALVVISCGNDSAKEFYVKEPVPYAIRVFKTPRGEVYRFKDGHKWVYVYEATNGSGRGITVVSN